MAKASVAGAPPYWAYAVNSSTNDEDAGKLTRNVLQHVPGSSAGFTSEQIANFYTPPDWHPDGHPAMPEIVSQGRAPEVYACGYCHLPNGQGRPENANLAGLPADYISRQLTDFSAGRRRSSEPKHGPTRAMIGVAQGLRVSEVHAAAEYFAALKTTSWIRVVETDTVPKTHVAGWMLVADASGGMEPIGERIIETPENLERTELRDDRSGFVAYVPVGSIAKGAARASGQTNGWVACATCHGLGLKGLGKAPPIAGRSPSYLVRQLYDFQSGARAGAESLAMKPAVANMTLDDIVAIAAYVSSLRP